MVGKSNEDVRKKRVRETLIATYTGKILGDDIMSETLILKENFVRVRIFPPAKYQ